MEIGMISLRELEYRLDRNMAMQLIDLRAPADYQKFHIKGAVNLPYSQLKERLLELQPAPPLIFYCARGGTSLQADGGRAGNLCIIGNERYRPLQRPSYDSQLTRQVLGYKIVTAIKYAK